MAKPDSNGGPTLGLILGLILLASCNSSSGGQDRTSKIPSFKAEVAKVDLTDNIWDGHAISYGGFRAGQRPGGAYPSDAEILEDLRLLEKNWNLIRFYNADEHGAAVLRVIQAHDIDLKVMLGIYIFQTKDLTGDALAANEALNQQFIGEGVRLATQYPELVAGINVGNEVLVSWSFVPNDLSTIIRYVRQVAAGLDSAALDIPVTVADNYAFWESEDALLLAAELDFITVHGYAMWDGCPLSRALDFLSDHVAAVKANLPDVPIIVGETGWATYAEDGQIYGQIGAEANEVNAARYFDEVAEWAETEGITTILFEAFDEPWKSEGNDGAAEGHWGVFDANRKAKFAMVNFYPELVSATPTSPSYEDFQFIPSVGVAPAFRTSTAADLTITATAEALDSCTMSLSANAFEGSQSLRFSHTGAAKGGFYSLFSPMLDTSDHTRIVFALSGVPAEAAYFGLRLEGGGAGHSLNILSYPPRPEGDWSIFSLPLSDFVGVDRSQINALGFWHPFSKTDYAGNQGQHVAAEIYIDDLHFE